METALTAPSRPRETLITRFVTEVAGRDQHFTLDLARALLGAAASQPDSRLGARAERLLEHLPAADLRLRREVSFAHDRWLDVFRRFPERSALDWVFDSPDFALVVEVKTNKRTGFQHRQLERYHLALTARNSPVRREHCGLLALTPYVPYRYEVPTTRSKRFIGTIQWGDAAGALLGVRPADAADALRWSTTVQHLVDVDSCANSSTVAD